MTSRKLTSGNKKMSDECLSSSSTLEIVLDDRSISDSIDDDSNSQTRHPKSGTKDAEHLTYRRRKQIALTNTKSHRLIEKRRRDRMNRSLNVLLNLIPHRKPENQRRIEKTEIIEMAIEHIRGLVSSTQKSSKPLVFDKKSYFKIDSYRSGYHNGTYDTYEYIEKNFNNNKFLTDLIRYIKDKETELKDLTVIPDRKDDIKVKVSSSENIPSASCDKSNSDANLCAISDVRISEDHENIFQFSIDQQHNPAQQTKVPIFVLHPSGTHYIPMSIDSSIVSHAFNRKSNMSQLPSINDQLQCHPVSIPVNFNPMTAISDPYELDIQNINVIGTRLQTSVRPN